MPTQGSVNAFVLEHKDWKIFEPPGTNQYILLHSHGNIYIFERSSEAFIREVTYKLENIGEVFDRVFPVGFHPTDPDKLIVFRRLIQKSRFLFQSVHIETGLVEVCFEFNGLGLFSQRVHFHLTRSVQGIPTVVVMFHNENPKLAFVRMFDLYSGEVVENLNLGELFPDYWSVHCEQIHENKKAHCLQDILHQNDTFIN